MQKKPATFRQRVFFTPIPDFPQLGDWDQRAEGAELVNH
jgi:hypothetical protein